TWPRKNSGKKDQRRITFGYFFQCLTPINRSKYYSNNKEHSFLNYFMYFNKKAFSGLQLLLLLFILIGYSQCKEADKLPPGDPDNGGLALPDGFEAVVVSD